MPSPFTPPSIPSTGPVLLTRTALSGSAASVDITGISQSFVHLWIIALLRTDEAVTNSTAAFRFNNDSGANYDRESAIAQNVTASATNGPAQTSMLVFSTGATATAGSFALVEILVPFYAGASLKVCRVLNAIQPNNAAANMVMATHMQFWRATSAVNRVTFIPGGGTNLVAGTSVDVYGLS